VALSLQLGFAVWPLMRFTSDRAKMGEFVNPAWLKVLGWGVTALIITLNAKLVLDEALPAAWRQALGGI
jgi:manganese transport protein